MTPCLTPRETEVMDLLADGLSREQIAQRLGISYETVKYKLRHAREKYDAPSTLVAIGRHTVARYQRAQATAA